MESSAERNNFATTVTLCAGGTYPAAAQKTCPRWGFLGSSRLASGRTFQPVFAVNLVERFAASSQGRVAHAPTAARAHAAGRINCDERLSRSRCRRLVITVLRARVLATPRRPWHSRAIVPRNSRLAGRKNCLVSRPPRACSDGA